jgi:hypothetical protein
MADREISLGGGLTFLNPSKGSIKEGESVRGRYVGIIEGKFKPSYKLQQADGSVKAINSSGKLAKLMEQVPLQSEITVTYTGKSAIENGEYKGTMAHDYKVTLHSDDAPVAKASGLPF